MSSVDGWVKLHRKMLLWEWAKSPNTLALFVHLLLTANWTDTEYKGVPLKRGQVITSLPKLAAETGLTIRQTRSSLKHLQMTGEVTDSSSPRGRIITVVSFEKYQGATDSATGKRQTKRQTDRQTNGHLNKNTMEEGRRKKERARADALGGTASLPEEEHGKPLPDDFWDDPDKYPEIWSEGSGNV